ncbi:Chs3 chitin synthase [Phlyctochytrium arcticum]|nr:Chs3 chitin synthase [Phlyctochytrium arcticum]
MEFGSAAAGIFSESLLTAFYKHFTDAFVIPSIFLLVVAAPITPACFIHLIGQSLEYIDPQRSRTGHQEPHPEAQPHQRGPLSPSSQQSRQQQQQQQRRAMPGHMPLPPNNFGPARPALVASSSNALPSTGASSRGKNRSQHPGPLPPGNPPPPPSTHMHPFNQRLNNHNGVQRKRSLVKRDRSVSRGDSRFSMGFPRHDLTLGRKSLSRRKSTLSGIHNEDDSHHSMTWWTVLTAILTFYLPAPVLRLFGMKDPLIQQAFREKIALCTIITLAMAFVGFITFGFNLVTCQHGIAPIRHSQLANREYFAVRGKLYNAGIVLTNIEGHPNVSINPAEIAGKDLSFLFPVVNGRCAATLGGGQNKTPYACSLPGFKTTLPFCHDTYADKPRNIIATFRPDAELFMTYQDVYNSTNYLVYNGNVLDLTRLAEQPNFLGADFHRAVEKNRGKDATKIFLSRAGFKEKADCLDETFRIAKVDASSFGCVVSDVLLYVSFTLIMGTVGAKFILAVIFQYLIGWKLGERDKDSRVRADRKRRQKELEANGGQHGMPNARPGQTSEDGAIQMGNLQIVHPDNKDAVAGGAGSVPKVKKLLMLGGAPPAPARTNSSGSTIGKNRNIPVSPLKSRGPDGKVLQQPTLPDVALPHDHFDPTSQNQFLDLQLAAQYGQNHPILHDPTLMHTLMLVTCYSESYASLRSTLDSLARTYYPSTHKTIFVIADGVVQGSGEPRTTPDYLIDMMEIDERFPGDDPRKGGEPQAFSYVAIANGNRRKNYARVYAGWYKYALADEAGQKGNKSAMMQDEEDMTAMTGSGGDGDANPNGKGKLARSNTLGRTLRHRRQGKVPMILVVKVGNEEERSLPNTSKPGNRGKRDSQVLLMQFLTKVMFDDRMTELEFDIFHKLWLINGIHPGQYESVLMVDADTRVYPDSITHLVACFLKDPNIMGVCGETKIYNKWQSWVTMIQVYEYYISHHLSKAFESVFGGVTCLPGCFSAYRIKAPKADAWVPILANPDVVEAYSENIVDTLHQKNLLLLGEDRYLTTLMLKAFPKRRNVFVPSAICKTVVPDSFKVLLSQRRRWINSTIHNLLELVLVRDLCGTFCFSMQFVIFMELIGSIILPAATGFTIYLIVNTIVSHNPQFAPLLMLAAILGLPAVLILLTIRRVIYLFWFGIYLIALPMWQVVLPLYAFWHFDDFSWGETRKVHGEVEKDHSRREGTFDHSGISMKRWSEWVRERAALVEVERRRRMMMGGHPMHLQQQRGMASSPPPGTPLGPPAPPALVTRMNSSGSYHQHHPTHYFPPQHPIQPYGQQRLPSHSPHLPPLSSPQPLLTPLLSPLDSPSSLGGNGGYFAPLPPQRRPSGHPLPPSSPHSGPGQSPLQPLSQPHQPYAHQRPLSPQGMYAHHQAPQAPIPPPAMARASQNTRQNQASKPPPISTINKQSKRTSILLKTPTSGSLAHVQILSPSSSTTHSPTSSSPKRSGW